MTVQCYIGSEGGGDCEGIAELEKELEELRELAANWKRCAMARGWVRERFDVKEPIDQDCPSRANVEGAKSALRQLFHSGLLDNRDYLRGEVEAGLRCLGVEIP